MRIGFPLRGSRGGFPCPPAINRSMGVFKLFKLNFEKTVIFVLILIIAISTANIYTQFFGALGNHREPNKVQMDIIKNMSFPAGLLKADQLYNQGLYKEAQTEYLQLTAMQDLSSQKKATVYFKLGICNYRLGEYDMAIDSFLKTVEYNPGDSAAYNNAAVCAFYDNNLEKAAELQKKAIAILPIIEYHYNIARIYEDSGMYEDAVKYYSAVVRGEENITRDDRIDPIRVKNKLMKLVEDMENIEFVSKELMIALKLKETRSTLIIEDKGMDLKKKDFDWRIARENGADRLYCSYDRETADPYNLIDSVEWTLKRDGKTVGTGKKDSFSYLLSDEGTYTVYLHIRYNTNNISSSQAEVKKGSGAFAGVVTPEPVTKPVPKPSEETCKYYEFATYEQVFEKEYAMREMGYVDRFDVVWGKDDLVTRLDSKDFIDAQGSLYIKNTSNKRAGIWTDLSQLINNKRLKGKTIGIKFYAKKLSEDANLHVSTKIKTGRTYKNNLNRYELDYKWKLYTINLPIPSIADGLTMSFKTGIWEEVQIDGFIIYLVK